MVYFIEAHGTGRVKIGHTMGGKPALMNRIEDLQTGCPLSLVAIAVMPGGAPEERALHRKFRGLHERGEWFRLEGDLAALVGLHRLKQPLSVSVYVPRAVKGSKQTRARAKAQGQTAERTARLRSGRWHPLDALFDD